MMSIARIKDLAGKANGEPVYHDRKLYPPSLYYRFFKLLAEEMKPRLSVVLGVCGGGDCLHLALGNPEGKVVGVDIAYDHPEQLEHIKAACPNFSFILGDSVNSAKKVFDDHGMVDILFIDTDHTLGSTIKEYKAWKPYLAPGAVVCFDDLFRPGMEEAWDSIPEPKVRQDFLHDGTYPHGGGFGVHIHEGATMIPPMGYELGC